MHIINLLLTNILSSNSLELSLLGEAIFKAFWRCTPVVSWSVIISIPVKTARLNPRFGPVLRRAQTRKGLQKIRIFSNIFERFALFFEYFRIFSNVFKRFRTFSNATCAFDAKQSSCSRCRLGKFQLAG